jgi:N-acetylglucosaminyl-diphospho-decaprenol L-rhamnosyltransferase
MVTQIPVKSDPQTMSAPQRVFDIAVVIVTYRSAPLTIACLKSLQGERADQTLRIRAVVVDNASGDLPEISRAVEDYQWSQWVTLVSAPRNGGFAYGNNFGIERAYAAGIPSYFFLLNPDTEVRPGAVAALVRFMETHPAAGIAGPSFETGDGDDWEIAFRFPTLLSELEEGLQLGLATRLLRRWAVVHNMGDQSEAVDWVSGSSMMIRPEVFATVGGLDENYFLYFEETDLCRRARRAGFTTWYVPESRVMHIGGENTKAIKRHPPCWFESRRRYFALTYGMAYAALIDIVAVGANLLGALKRLIQGRPRGATPSFIRDLVHHSVLWNRNRNIPPVRSRSLGGACAAQTNRGPVQPRT